MKSTTREHKMVLKGLLSRQKILEVKPDSYLQNIIENNYIHDWMEDLWTYCHATRLPDEVAYTSFQIYTNFVNLKPRDFVQSRWFSHACIWIACKLFFDHPFRVKAMVERVKGKVSHRKLKKYVRKLVKNETRIVTELKYEFHKPTALDFVNTLVPLLKLPPRSRTVKEIMEKLKLFTNSHITSPPVELAVHSILAVTPQLSEQVHSLVES